MKAIALTNIDLRILSGQLQNYQAGYTVAQIRLLDKVVGKMEEQLEPFVKGLKDITSGPIAFSTQEEREKLEKEQDDRVQEYAKAEGQKIQSVSFEDSEFEFIKQVWLRMGSLSGMKEARETIMKIDDAIEAATEPVFDKKLPN